MWQRRAPKDPAPWRMGYRRPDTRARGRRTGRRLAGGRVPSVARSGADKPARHGAGAPAAAGSTLQPALMATWAEDPRMAARQRGIGQTLGGQAVVDPVAGGLRGCGGRGGPRGKRRAARSRQSGRGSGQRPARLCARRAPLLPNGEWPGQMEPSPRSGRGSANARRRADARGGLHFSPTGRGRGTWSPARGLAGARPTARRACARGGLCRLPDGAAVHGVAVRGRGVHPSCRDECRGPKRPRPGASAAWPEECASVWVPGRMPRPAADVCSADPSGRSRTQEGPGGRQAKACDTRATRSGDLGEVRCERLRPAEARTRCPAAWGTSRPVYERRLEGALGGRTVSAAEELQPLVLRLPVQGPIGRRLTGRQLARVEHRGKFLTLGCDDGAALEVRWAGRQGSGGATCNRWGRAGFNEI